MRLLLPLVEGSRRRTGGIADAIWMEPYFLGFVVSMITLIARRTGGAMGSHRLALVQAEAWGALSGLDPDLVGMETCLLSIGRDPGFGEGCAAAVELCESLDLSDPRWPELRGAELRWSDLPPQPAAAAGRLMQVLWCEHFDAHLAVPIPVRAH